MTSKILLNYKNAVFYPNFPIDADMPIILGLQPRCHVAAKGAPMNFHEDIEITFYLKGDADCIRGDRVYHAKTEDVTIANSYVPHKLVVTKDGMGYFSIIIHSSFCKYNSIDVTSLWFTEQIHDVRLIQMFYRLIELYKGDTPWKNTAIKLAVLDILLFLCQNYSTPQAAQPPALDKSWKYVYAAIQYIKENISRKLTVSEIAEHAGASESHFMREFKRITGATVTSYINTARCEYAENLLQTGKYKIKEVAALCGFENEEYFTKVFKKHCGQAPSDYIKSIHALGHE